MKTDRVPLKDVVDKEAEVEKVAKENTPINRGREMSFLDNTDYHAFSDYLEVSFEERRDSKVAEKISFLYDWGKEVTGKDDRLRISEEVKNLKRTLGFQEKGTNLIEKLYRYVRLDQQRRKIEKEMRLYE